MTFMSLLCVALGALALSGCASTTKQHFDTDASAIRAGKTAPTNANRATVFLMRESALGQGFLPPLFYAVDEIMVSTMPIGAYVPLSLEPGPHTFTRFIVVPGGGLARFEIARADVKLDLVAGQTYYVSEVNAFFDTFRHVANDRGRSILDGVELAKFIHAPVKTSVFVSRLQDAERVRRATAATAQQPSPSAQARVPDSAGYQDLLPSSEQVGGALEAVATVALVALYILALGAAGSGGSPHIAAPVSFSPPPSFSQPSTPTRAGAKLGLDATRDPVGRLKEVERMLNERTVTNAATGVKYVIDEDRVKGSDGSRYKVSGTMMYSDSGQSYQVVADKFIYASDGRSCTLIAEKLHCN